MTTHMRRPTAPVPTATSSQTVPSIQRAAGTAALVTAATYVVGFLFMGAVLMPAGLTDPVSDPTGSLEFLRGHATVMYLWYLALYLIGGAAMTVVALGVAHRLRPAPDLARASLAFGLIWSGLLLASGLIALVGQHAALDLAVEDPDVATSVWVAVGVVQDALGGGIEFVGALWALIVGSAALRTRVLPAGLAWLAVVLAVAGAATLVPPAADAAGALFGIGFIVWFTWAGRALTRA